MNEAFRFRKRISLVRTPIRRLNTSVLIARGFCIGTTDTLEGRNAITRRPFNRLAAFPVLRCRFQVHGRGILGHAIFITDPFYWGSNSSVQEDEFESARVEVFSYML
ncbi:hypothetical protein CEXT_127061 [Caerostris extrusa]|uniref:Uncharacterized protein n=1 Tax=Caerostris extrusa TaxID=172846 RepID=A0AAV4Y122_CAEEX|nr:hypothetical protein CEXT_127061 [Caerostris extrusa]